MAIGEDRYLITDPDLNHLRALSRETFSLSPRGIEFEDSVQPTVCQVNRVIHISDKIVRIVNLPSGYLQRKARVTCKWPDTGLRTEMETIQQSQAVKRLLGPRGFRIVVSNLLELNHSLQNVVHVDEVVADFKLGFDKKLALWIVHQDFLPLLERSIVLSQDHVNLAGLKKSVVSNR